MIFFLTNKNLELHFQKQLSITVPVSVGYVT